MAEDRTAIEHLVDYWTPLLVRMCVEAGVLDAFARQARTIDDVAVATGTDAGALARIVRALAGSGVFEAVEGGEEYRLSELGRRLLSDEPGSLAGLAAFRPFEVHAWAECAASLRSGGPAFPGYFGHGFWDHLAADPALGRLFDEQMQRRTNSMLSLGLTAYDWPHEGVVVDVGGGNGLLLRRLLEHRPGLRGVLFDRPQVVAQAAPITTSPDTASRVTLVGGDVFADPIPGGGDVYVLASVLHDWDDEQAGRILARCREAMPPAARLVLFEWLLAEGTGWDLAKLVDLHMLVLFGGKERTEADWRTLLDRSGFTMSRIVPTPGLAWIEARIGDRPRR